jgi:large subunit ribosomal protein L10
MPKVAEYKKKLVEDMSKLMRQYNIVGIVNMESLPAPQLQLMKRDMRGKLELFMTKKRLMKIALEKTKNEKKKIEDLEQYFEGMPAFIFTNENPFKLSKLLRKSKASAPAKAGQTAPNDIIIAKGPTPFAPGPVISELSEIGLKVGVEDGKVAVKEDSVVAKKGEKIKPKVAEILTRLDIKPMEVGLGLIAAYEDGIIYQKDILDVDEKEYNDNINLAAVQAFNLAFNIVYVTKDNAGFLIAKAFNDAKALGVSQNIIDEGIIEALLGKAEMSMMSLKNNANIETKAQEVKPKEEKPAEEKPESKEEQPKEQPKAEEKKIESSTQEKILEEEKKIIKEEKELEKEQPKEAPVEQEVQEAVKKEEEKKLENERIEKEKELEEVEEPKLSNESENGLEKSKTFQKQEQKIEHPKPQEVKEEKPEDNVDTKVNMMVEKTKKFAEGSEETAADILKEIKQEEPEEEKEEKVEELKKEKEQEKVPSAHDLKESKENKENKEDKEQKEVEDLTKELLKKGTLRK